MEVEKRFLFQASAVGLAAHIRRQGDTAHSRVVPVQAASCLPTTGGHASAHASGQSFFGIVSFVHAFTRTTGDFVDRETAARLTRGDHGENDSPTETSVRAEVHGFRVVNRGPLSEHVLTCETAEVELRSVHPRDGSESSCRGLEASLDGLAIDGHQLEVTWLTSLFREHDTWAKLRDAYETDDTFYGEYGELFEPPGESTDARGGSGRRLAAGRDLCYTTIVRGVTWRDTLHPDAEIQGNRIVLRDFGTIHLGELFVSPHARELTMVRVQLGSPDGGEVAVATAAANGKGYPP